MADKTIGELTRAAQLDDDSLFVMEQQGEAFALAGAMLRDFAEKAAAALKAGATFTPKLTVTEEGVFLSFTNNAGLENPAPQNLTVKALTPADIGAVNKAGDTMTGNFTISKNTPILDLNDISTGAAGRLFASLNRVYMQNANIAGSDDNRRQLVVANSAVAELKNALVLNDVVGGVANVYTILHTGNKPSGSYTGNGDATARTIQTGGTGSAIAVWSTTGRSLIVAHFGAVEFGAVSPTSYPYTAAKYQNGVLTIATAEVGLNRNGTTYNYQVL